MIQLSIKYNGDSIGLRFRSETIPMLEEEIEILPSLNGLSKRKRAVSTAVDWIVTHETWIAQQLCAHIEDTKEESI